MTVKGLDSLDEHFPREFVNRIDAVCPFRALERDQVAHIIRDITLPGWIAAHKDQGIHLEVTEEALAHLASLGYSADLGARELHRVVETELLARVPVALGAAERGHLLATLEDGRISVRRIGDDGFSA